MVNFMTKVLISLTFLFSIFSSVSVLANSEFPGRAEFPEISLYSKSDLLKDLYKVVVVDARSSLEFETIRVKGAINIPIASKQFADKVKNYVRKQLNRLFFIATVVPVTNLTRQLKRL